MNKMNYTSSRPGTALLVVLIIVMVITITSLGFLSKSDVELACGENMIVRTQMDYLAESGLEHARGLLLNPQDTGAQYWAGAEQLQLKPGSSDYYNVTVIPDAADRCNYTINCDAYRMMGTERTGFTSLTAELRLDPCIAYWVGSNTTVWPQMTIKGDVYCGGTLTNNGIIYGDAFAADVINVTGTLTGQNNPTAPVAWPGLAISKTYYIGSTPCLADEDTSAEADVVSKAPSGANPARIYCYTGNANMSGNVTINGTLVINGNLTVSGTNYITTAQPNFPALIVNGQVIMKNGASLVINGLAQIGDTIKEDASTLSAAIKVTGGLCIYGGGVTSPLITVIVTADPAIAAIEIWPAPPGTPQRWGPAAGAFFKSIKRNM